MWLFGRSSTVVQQWRELLRCDDLVDRRLENNDRFYMYSGVVSTVQVVDDALVVAFVWRAMSVIEEGSCNRKVTEALWRMASCEPCIFDLKPRGGRSHASGPRVSRNGQVEFAVKSGITVEGDIDTRRWIFLPKNAVSDPSFNEVAR